ncbi:C40 family peptidase [Neobacillus sp. PS3-40]|uniref:C40 family peptidase n=1 Tax=Neobacillus sp. PS3-40 TaxID=3070679 RepID=UPI0027DF0C5F|nr:C40 family peptidase [Neobacillus sp. PS3-40]WML46118.1 C40 family peptidase [Neobacillus sp. PS3-40]
MKNILRFFAVFALVLPLLVGTQTTAKAAEKNELTDFAKTLIGVPYKWGGTTPQGFDCSGFLTYVYKHYGVELPRSSADQFSQGEKISNDEMVPGDILFFTTYKSGPSHSAIYLGDNKFIHASPQGIEIANLNMSYYKARYLGARRFIQPEQVKDVTSLLPVKQGQVGTVYIKKKMNLWQKDENNNLIKVRVLNPGEMYRVYQIDDSFGGQYNLGSQLYVTNIENYLEYIPAGN